MADNDQYNDEYQFADLDAITPSTGDEAEGDGTTNASEPTGVKAGYQTKDIKRNALIVVVAVIVAMLLYKLASSVFSEKKVDVDTIVPPVTVASPIPSPSVVPATPTPTSDTNVSQKISALELGQQNMRSDISSVNDQLTSISTTLSTLSAKIAELNGIIVNLSAKVDEQSHEIEQITIRREVKKGHSIKHNSVHYPKYYIQAVIPGRAWLIASNGATLTVREGTLVAGYGMVKLIDPNQGRVMTSSGQVIKFSQEDS